ncbi:GRIP and coiled-coil domain-containing protein [Senna tora]|uniref:GRIP and coiled-coil domain-containing protein n=1 Tax=Senna tora TaxID=362788 RepID=A0A834WPH7_9FABA|nr:GRIP and coiled-coil domain-containing protein [Senna tora]
MAKRVGNRRESALTRAVGSVFAFVRLAEFEILFFFFFVIAYVLFKDITSRPEYNQILVKKPGGIDLWPY